jgi:cation diffusion facilitator family transporter
MARTSGSGRVVITALAGNLAVAASKFAAFALSGSTALLTEGVHSLVDTADQVLLLVGQRRAARAADRSHPFGYGQEAYFWSFVVALLIFLAGGLVSVAQGWRRIFNPVALERPLVSFGVLGVSTVFEGLSFAVAYREYRRIVAGSEVTLLGFLRLSKDPSVFGTLLEDGAALIGLLLAAAGVSAATWLHLAWADGAASVLIGALLLAVALFMANETRSLIAGESAAPVIEARLRAAAEAAAPPFRLADLVTLQLGPRAILVVATLEGDPRASLAATERCAARVKAACAAADPRTREVLLRLAGTAARAAADMETSSRG